MGQTFQVDLSEQAVQRIKEIAEYKNSSIEDVLKDWIEQAAEEPPIESLPDDEVLALADMEMDTEQDEELSDLLAQQQEDEITDEGQARLAELMSVYRRGSVRKAQAMRVAVERGLRPRLNT